MEAPKVIKNIAEFQLPKDAASREKRKEHLYIPLATTVGAVALGVAGYNALVNAIDHTINQQEQDQAIHQEEMEEQRRFNQDLETGAVTIDLVEK